MPTCCLSSAPTPPGSVLGCRWPHRAPYPPAGPCKPRQLPRATTVPHNKLSQTRWLPAISFAATLTGLGPGWKAPLQAPGLPGSWQGFPPMALHVSGIADDPGHGSSHSDGASAKGASRHERSPSSSRLRTRSLSLPPTSHWLTQSWRGGVGGDMPPPVGGTAVTLGKGREDRGDTGNEDALCHSTSATHRAGARAAPGGRTPLQGPPPPGLRTESTRAVLSALLGETCGPQPSLLK